MSLEGYLVGRLGVLGPNAPHVLSRLAFFVLSPALLFTVLTFSYFFGARLGFASAIETEWIG